MAILSHVNSQIGARLTYEYGTVHCAPLIEHKRLHFVNTAYSASFTFALLDKLVQHVELMSISSSPLTGKKHMHFVNTE